MQCRLCRTPHATVDSTQHASRHALDLVHEHVLPPSSATSLLERNPCILWCTWLYEAAGHSQSSYHWVVYTQFTTNRKTSHFDTFSETNSLIIPFIRHVILQCPQTQHVVASRTQRLSFADQNDATAPQPYCYWRCLLHLPRYHQEKKTRDPQLQVRGYHTIRYGSHYSRSDRPSEKCGVSAYTSSMKRTISNDYWRSYTLNCK